jgi:hypothetical protein
MPAAATAIYVDAPVLPVTLLPLGRSRTGH